MALFLCLSITFFLLAAGVTHPRSDKVNFTVELVSASTCKPGLGCMLWAALAQAR